MTQTRRIKWKREPDVSGYAAGITSGNDLIAEATVTPRPDRTAVYDVLGRDGLTIVASGEARTVADAKRAAEDAMRRVVVRAA